MKIEIRAWHARDERRLGRESSNELQQPAVSGGIDGHARIRRHTGTRPIRQLSELDGLGADQPRTRLRQVHRVYEERGPLTRLDEPPKIHREVDRVSHQPGRKSHCEGAQPLLAGVVDAVPWSLVAVAGRSGIAEEVE